MANNTHVIVVGNEKGGTGKSTVAFNLSIYLLLQGYGVATLDIDSRQQTMTRYVRNRSNFARQHGEALPQTYHYHLPLSRADFISDRDQLELDLFRTAISEVDGAVDFIVIDSPGFDTNLARLAHSLADTIVTPINDSLIDLDVIVRLDETDEPAEPSHYTRLVQRARRRRIDEDAHRTNWVLLRNRVAPLMSRNTHLVQEKIAKLAAQFDYIISPGISERTIYRSLFATGLTAFDRPDLLKTSCSTDVQLRVRQEYLRFVQSVGLVPYRQTAGLTASGASSIATFQEV